MSLFKTLRRLRQEDCEFQASLGCITRPHLKNRRKEKNELNI
jgi:hypothetical protein